MNENYYEVLEIPSDADEREIKRAYHRLARDLHPDKATNPEEAKDFEEKFAQVSSAYNTLKDPAKRAEHDKRVQGSGAGGAQRKPTATSAVLQAGRGVPPPQQNSGGASGTGGPSGTGGAGGGSASKGGESNNGGAAARPAMGITPQRISIAQKAFARGMQFFKEGNHLKAIEFFDAAIQNNDAEAVYHARLAVSLIQAKKSATRAIDAAQRAIELDTYNLDYKFDLGTIYETIGSKTNAQKTYEEILRWDAGNARALQALARLKSNKGAAATFSAGSGGTPQLSHKTAEGGGFLKQILNKFKK